MNNLEPLLSAQQLADYLEAPIATLYAWRHRGEGPPGFRVGRHIRYRRTDVELWKQWQLMRVEKLKKPLTQIGYDRLVKDLALVETLDLNERLERAIDAKWQGLVFKDDIENAKTKQRAIGADPGPDDDAFLRSIGIGVEYPAA